MKRSYWQWWWRDYYYWYWLMVVVLCDDDDVVVLTIVIVKLYLMIWWSDDDVDISSIVSSINGSNEVMCLLKYYYWINDTWYLYVMKWLCDHWQVLLFVIIEGIPVTTEADDPRDDWWYSGEQWWEAPVKELSVTVHCCLMQWLVTGGDCEGGQWFQCARANQWPDDDYCWYSIIQ